jgi:Protein of unknown function (DUF1573)
MLRFRFIHRLSVLMAFALISGSSFAQSPGSSGPLATGGFSSEGNDAIGQLAAPGTSNGRSQVRAIDPVFNFGKVYSGTTVRHTFRLKNTGAGALTIAGVRTSCGCTAAQPTKTRVFPGEESDIAVSFDTRTDRGPATRTITVFTNDPSHQQVQLTMRGDVKAQVETNPSVVIFERVKRGSERSQQVTLTDEMPDRTFEVTGIKNANPYIKVASQTTRGAKPAASLTISLLKTAPAGPVTDVIRVNTNRVPVEIPVSGTVLGDINVNPPQVSFGIVPHHAAALRIVRLTNSGEHPVKVTGISSNNTSVVGAVEPVKTGREYKISVQLAPNTPDGVLRGMLAIKTDDPHQQDVQVPFYGIVGSFKG